MQHWGVAVKAFRQRHGLTQRAMGDLLGVAQRTISRWERGDDNPSLQQQKRLRDLGREVPADLVQGLATSIVFSPAPRALSRTRRLVLQAVSIPAVEKRPSITNWLGRPLDRIATGVLRDMLDDAELRKGLARREVAAVIATTRSVLDTPEARRIKTFRTTISYFHHDGTFFSDAVSAPAPDNAQLGYSVVSMDDTEAFRIAGQSGGEAFVRAAQSRWARFG